MGAHSTMTSSSSAGDAARSKLVIGFDADDTLWHNEKYYRGAGEKFKRLLSSFQAPVLIEQALAETEVRNIRWYGYGFKSYTLSMLETAAEIAGEKISPDVVRNILQFGRDMLSAEVVLLEHADDTLKRLAQQHDLMLITKGDLLEQQGKIGRSGLAGLFRYTEIVQEKAAATYRLLLDRYGIPASRFVMVGNSLKSDILPALEVGARAVFIPAAHTWAHEHAEAGGKTYFEIEHLGLLPGLIASLDA
jgi:putative hydrolase of the HAD superfamily